MKALTPKFKTKTVWKFNLQHKDSEMWHERTYDSEAAMLRSANVLIQDGTKVTRFISEEIKVIESFTQKEG